MMELKWLWFITSRIAVLSVVLVLGDACLEKKRMAVLKIEAFSDLRNELVNRDEVVKGSDCCEWKRIECNTSRRLIGLSLNSTRTEDMVNWHLDASLFLPFVELKSLYLQGNAIAGCSQNEGFEKLSSKLRNLENLELSWNYLNDTIILSWSRLSSL